MNFENKNYRMPIGILSISAITACSDITPPNSETLLTSPSTSETHIQIPSQIGSARVVDRNNLYAILSFNGISSRWDSNTTFTTTYNFRPGDNIIFEIDWFETLGNGENLLLASWNYSDTSVQAKNIQINVLADAYTTTGSRFDIDGDGISNLQERIDGTYPDDTVTAFPSTVSLPRIDSIFSPFIDGLYDQSYDNARFLDISGAPLAIDNLLVSEGIGALRQDGDTEFQWFGMHDGEFMYIFVLAEGVGFEQLPPDSGNEYWQDDSISIFIDGNNSKDVATDPNNPSYDGVDDRHFVIPLLTASSIEDEAGVLGNRSQFQVGFRSSPIPSFDFATCFCTAGRNAFELKIPIREFGIVVGEPFGFDVHLDLDHDGGSRDVKWSWHRPADPTVNVDDSWYNPSVFGTIILEL